MKLRQALIIGIYSIHASSNEGIVDNVDSYVDNRFLKGSKIFLLLIKK